MRIMLDTNVLISIIIFNSNTLKDMLIEICDKNTLDLSSYIIEELEDVIERKFPNKREYLDRFLFKLPYELEFIPETILNENIFKIRDVKDVPVLHSAIISDVDILITGDKDFENIDIEKPENLTPTEYIENYIK